MRHDAIVVRTVNDSLRTLSAVSLALTVARGCSGERMPNRTFPPLVIERPESTQPPVALTPPGEGLLPLRAWNRASGGMISIDDVAQISVHDTQICTLLFDGSVWCLRTDGLVNGNVFVPDMLGRNMLRVTLPQPAREVVAGSSHACAIGTDGAAWCWGTNDQGELGDGTTASHPEPERVRDLNDVVQIAAGERFTCARTLDERVFCWGTNNVGQLGDGSRIARRLPMRVRGLPAVADIAAGRQHVCARTHDGRAFCWGDNSHRQLGCTSYSDLACTDPAQNEVRPVRVPEVDHVSQLALGDVHSCARRFDDTVACWGERTNGSGQTGYGRTAWHDGWIATEVASGPNGSCAVMGAGTVRCWGDFAFEPFERGEVARRSYELPGVRGATTVAMGDRVTCVRFGDGNVRCWLR